MNWDHVQGNWKRVVGITREHWGMLTDDLQDIAAGRQDRLAGQAQLCYGSARVAADRQLALRGHHADAGRSSNVAAIR